jgi:hypothetical protein
LLLSQVVLRSENPFPDRVTAIPEFRSESNATKGASGQQAGRVPHLVDGSAPEALPVPPQWEPEAPSLQNHQMPALNISDCFASDELRFAIWQQWLIDRPGISIAITSRFDR